MGNNPATINVGDSYIDPGASVADDKDHNLGIEITGASIDTMTAGTYTVLYNAVDNDGNKAAEVTRTVIVGVQTEPSISGIIQPEALEPESETATTSPSEIVE